MAHVRRRGHLALIDARVPMLRIFDLQDPVLRVRMMDGPKALVRRVRVSTDGQQMDVTVANPRHLQNRLWREIDTYENIREMYLIAIIQLFMAGQR